jgi:riboflavin synthase
VAYPRRYDALVVEKGSIAINGVSLTVARCGPGRLEVALIPYTLSRTNLGELRAGATVNLELDYLAKLVQRVVALSRPGSGRRRSRSAPDEEKR